MCTPQMAASNSTMAQRDYLRRERPSEPLSAPPISPRVTPAVQVKAIRNHGIAQQLARGERSVRGRPSSWGRRRMPGWLVFSDDEAATNWPRKAVAASGSSRLSVSRPRARDVTARVRQVVDRAPVRRAEEPRNRGWPPADAGGPARRGRPPLGLASRVRASEQARGQDLAAVPLARGGRCWMCSCAGEHRVA
jgi:hypothetical protein